jgi:hypothetical protein
MATTCSFDLRTVAEETGVTPEQCASVAAVVLRELHRVATIHEDGLVGTLKAACSQLGPEACYHVGGLLELSRIESDDGVPWPSVMESIDSSLLTYQVLVEQWKQEVSTECLDGDELDDADAGVSAETLNLCDHVTIVVSRRDVEACDVETTLACLQRLIETPKTARDFMERVAICFHGYDHTREELWEIPEVRNFVHRLDDKFPYWLFFLDKVGSGLQCIVWCFLLPFLTPEARAIEHPRKLAWLMENRWFPAMNAMCGFVGLPERENESLTERALDYVLKGPIRSSGAGTETT